MPRRRAPLIPDPPPVAEIAAMIDTLPETLPHATINAMGHRITQILRDHGNTMVADLTRRAIDGSAHARDVLRLASLDDRPAHWQIGPVGSLGAVSRQRARADAACHDELPFPQWRYVSNVLLAMDLTFGVAYDATQHPARVNESPSLMHELLVTYCEFSAIAADRADRRRQRKIRLAAA